MHIDCLLNFLSIPVSSLGTSHTLDSSLVCIMTSCGYAVELLVAARHILYYSCCFSSYFDFLKYFIYFADVFFH